MLKIIKATLVAALALGAAGAAGAQPITSFDARATDNWAEKLVLCDTAAFLAGQPNLDANVIYTRRDDARRFDMLLPPNFVGGGQWYKEGYERLYFRLKAEKKIGFKELLNVQNDVGRRFVDSYRKGGRYEMATNRFLREQDSYCHSMARENGVIVS